MKTINECLMSMKKDDMRETAFRLGLHRLPEKARKAEWAAYIEKSMMEEPDRVRMMMTVDDMEMLQELLAKGNCISEENLQDCPWEAIGALSACGLSYFAQDRWYIQPCVNDMLVMDEEEREDHHTLDVFADLIEGWLLHVGMMPLFQLRDWLLDEIRPQEKDRRDVQAAFLAVLIARRGSECLYTDEEERTWVMHEDVEDPDALLCRLQEPAIAVLNYPKFAAEDLIFSAAYSRLPGKLDIYNPMKDWLEAHDADDTQFEDAMEQLVLFTQNNDRDEAVNSVMGIIPPKSMEDAKRCCKAAQQVLNKIPLWMNKGYSAEELYLADQGKKAALPGRNDPCPCGSGRKYKHCCGKRVN